MTEEMKRYRVSVNIYIDAKSNIEAEDIVTKMMCGTELMSKMWDVQEAVERLLTEYRARCCGMCKNCKLPVFTECGAYYECEIDNLEKNPFSICTTYYEPEGD